MYRDLERCPGFPIQPANLVRRSTVMALPTQLNPLAAHNQVRARKSDAGIQRAVWQKHIPADNQ